MQGAVKPNVVPQSRQTLQRLHWAALDTPGSGERERGRGGSLLDPISHQNTLWWIHANKMQIEGCLWHLLFQLKTRQMFENTDVRSAINHPKLKTRARIKRFYGKERVFFYVTMVS